MSTRPSTILQFPLTAASTTTQAVMVVVMAVLTAIGAQIVIPRDPVPFTLQTLFVLLAGGLLGRERGAMSMGLYLVAGSIGLPVFSGAGFGLARIMGPTGGYLLAFPVAAFLIGWLLTVERPSFVRVVIAMVAGLTVIFTLGTLHLYTFTPLSFTEAVGSGFLMFTLWDLAKLASASAIVYALRRKA